MAEFKRIPYLSIGRDGQWNLVEPCIYQSDLWEPLITVPAGFETDLASIPSIFTPLIPKNGMHRAAAIVHDYLCRDKSFSRPLADRIFLEAMKLLGVPTWQRWSMFAAVRLNTARLQLMRKA